MQDLWCVFLFGKMLNLSPDIRFDLRLAVKLNWDNRFDLCFGSTSHLWTGLVLGWSADLSHSFTLSLNRSHSQNLITYIAWDPSWSPTFIPYLGLLPNILISFYFQAQSPITRLGSSRSWIQSVLPYLSRLLQMQPLISNLNQGNLGPVLFNCLICIFFKAQTQIWLCCPNPGPWPLLGSCLLDPDPRGGGQLRPVH